MRKIILIISCIAIGFLVGCGINIKAEHDGDFAWVQKETDNLKTTRVLLDRVTGVEYLVVHESYGVGVTPRYNADGTLYTGE